MPTCICTPDKLAEAIRRWFDKHAWDIRFREKADALRGEVGFRGRRPDWWRCPTSHKPGLAPRP